MARPRKESAESAIEVQDFVLMTKDGEEIEVHPSCVKAHEQAGWMVVQ